MKHTVLQLAIFAGIALLVFQLVLLADAEKAREEQLLAFEAQQLDLLTPLLREKQALEAQLLQQRQQMDAVRYAPSIAALLVTSQSKEIISQARSMTANTGARMLLGVTAAMADTWAASGTPEWVQGCMDEGWLLCPMADTPDALAALLGQFSALGFSSPAIARCTAEQVSPKEEAEYAALGVRLLLHGDTQSSDSSVLWRVPTFSRLTQDSLNVYYAAAGTGSGAVFTFGEIEMDSQYVLNNLSALASLMQRDRQSGKLHTLSPEEAYAARLAVEEGLTHMQDWQANEAYLLRALDEITARIQIVSPGSEL